MRTANPRMSFSAPHLSARGKEKHERVRQDDGERLPDGSVAEPPGVTCEQCGHAVQAYVWRAGEVLCLFCDGSISREEFQRWLEEEEGCRGGDF